MPERSTKMNCSQDMGSGSATWGGFFDSCCPFSTPLSPTKYVDNSLHASLSASRYFASGWIDRERKGEQKNPHVSRQRSCLSKPLCSHCLLCSAFAACLLTSASRCRGGCTGFSFFYFPPRIQAATRGFGLCRSVGCITRGHQAGVKI